jgi:hypothetical protein
VILHGIHGLHVSVRQGVDQFKRRDHFLVNVLDHGLILLTLIVKNDFILLPPCQEVGKELMHSIIQINSAVGVPRFERHQLHYTVLILHLTLNADRAIFQIDAIPFEAEALIDTQSAQAAQQICRFCVRSLEMFVHDGAFGSCECYDVQPFVCARFGHVNFRVLVDAKLVVRLLGQIIAGIGLPEN